MATDEETFWSLQEGRSGVRSSAVLKEVVLHGSLDDLTTTLNSLPPICSIWEIKEALCCASARKQYDHVAALLLHWILSTHSQRKLFGWGTLIHHIQYLGGEDVFNKVLEGMGQHGISPDEVDAERGTLLMKVVSATNEFNKAIHQILQLGADIDRKNLFGQTAFMKAAESYNLEAMNILQDFGANVTCDVTARGNVLHLLACSSARQQKQQTQTKLDWLVRRLIDSGVDPNDSTTSMEYSPLVLAAFNNSLPMMRTLISAGCKLNPPEGAPCQTSPLTAYLRNSALPDWDPCGMRMLIQAGVDINWVESNQTALTLSVKLASKPATRNLLQCNCGITVPHLKPCDIMMYALKNSKNNFHKVLMLAGYRQSLLRQVMSDMEKVHSFYILHSGGLASMRDLVTILPRHLWAHEDAYVHLSGSEFVWLQQSASNPVSLQQCCRLTIRQCLPCGYSVMDDILSLPAPLQLRNYLALGELDDWVNTEEQDDD